MFYGVFGYVELGEMLVIMGFFGLGKLILLDFLVGRLFFNVSLKGDIFVNGRKK